MVILYKGHAKGILLDGIFTPSLEANTLSKAQHFNEPPTSITVRFLSSTGNPDIAGSDPHSNPRGFALRFHLTYELRRVYTDIIGKVLEEPSSSLEKDKRLMKPLSVITP